MIDINASLESPYSSDLESGLLDGVASSSLTPGLPLVFNNVSVTLKNNRKILDNLSGVIRPGTLVGILGASGAGKSTLLNVLCGRTACDDGGVVTLGGMNVKEEEVRHSLAYVMQEDLFIGTLTVREHLQYTARLRMSPSISYQDKMKTVEKVIDQMGLQKSADTIIGTNFRRGISGGEKKRLSVASDLLMDPACFCADEPTSGLDSYMAEGVVRQLKLLAKQGKTVLATIHQPSPEVFELFDQVIFLAEGRIAYFQETSKVIDYLKEFDLVCPLYSNPADFTIRMLSTIVNEGEVEDLATKKERVRLLLQAWQDRGISAAQVESHSEEQLLSQHNYEGEEQIQGGSSSFTKPVGAGVISQVLILTSRSFKALSRDTMLTTVRFAQSLILALIAGAIYWQIGSQDMSNPQTILSISGALFFIITNQGFSGIFGVLQAFPLELPVFLREYAAGSYRVDTYYLSKTFAELPGQVLFPAIFGLIVYPMLGLKWDDFAGFLIAVILCAQAAMSLGYMVSTAAKSVQVALAVGPIAILPIMLFGGFYLNVDQIPSFLRWLQYISFFKYTFEILGINEFRDNPFAMKLYSFNADNYYTDIYILLGLSIGFRLVAFLFLYIRAKSSLKIQKLV